MTPAGFKQDGGEILKDVAVLSLDTLSWQQAKIQVRSELAFIRATRIYPAIAEDACRHAQFLPT